MPIVKRFLVQGFALNVNTDLSYYNWIIACEGEPVTSMERILGYEVDMAKIEDSLEKNFREVFDLVEHPVRREIAESRTSIVV